MKFTASLLILGDLIALFVFALVGSLSPPPSLTPLADLLGIFTVFALAWLGVGAAFKAFDPRRRLLGYFGRVLLTWLIVGFAGLIIRGLLLSSAAFDLLSLILIWSEGLANLLLWRVALRVIAALLTRPTPLRPFTGIGLTVMVVAVLLVAGLRVSLSARYSGAIYTVETVPTQPAALIFGAGLWYDGTPSTVLDNRVATGVALYHAGKVERLIMTGDSRAPEGDETAVMRQLALAAGVPDAAIVMDPAGIRTYDSCYRAARVYGATSVTLVTQTFHLVRSLYLCESLGLNVVGVAPIEDLTALRAQVGWELREIGATALAWWEVMITRPVVS